MQFFLSGGLLCLQLCFRVQGKNKFCIQTGQKDWKCVPLPRPLRWEHFFWLRRGGCLFRASHKKKCTSADNSLRPALIGFRAGARGRGLY